jgi:hypothetical protein
MGMDLDDAIKMHAAWKTKLAEYLRSPNGSLRSEELEPDNRCELGKWIHSSVAVHGHHAEYHAMKDEHARFHRAAAGVVRKAHEGASVSEEIALGSNSAFGVASQKLVLAIMGIKRKISSKPPAAR